MAAIKLASDWRNLADRFRRIANNDCSESDVRAAAAVAGALLPPARQHGLQLTFMEPSTVELQDNARQPDVIAHLWSTCWTSFIFALSLDADAPIPNPLAIKSEHRVGPNDITIGSTSKTDWRIRAENYAAVCDELADMAEGLRPAEIDTNKKSNTTPGAASAAILSALCAHHKFRDGGCGNWEPIGNNDLAKLSGHSAGAVSNFWKRKFASDGRAGTYEAYRRACGNGTLTYKLAFFRGEVSPANVFSLLKERDDGD